MVTSAALRLDPADLAVIAARVPHQEALRHKRRDVWFSWSWSDLVALSDRLAEALLARGIGAGSLVARVLGLDALRFIGDEVEQIPPRGQVRCGQRQNVIGLAIG